MKSTYSSPEDIAKTIRILSNFYRSPDQYGGNGLYNGWAQGNFTNGLGYRIFPRLGNFTLEITDGNRIYRGIDGEDQCMIDIPQIWVRYASEMLADYCKENNCEVIDETEDI
jgi:hypothetical protein